MTPKPRITEAAIVRQILDAFAAHRIPAWKINSGAMTATYKGKQRFVKFSFQGCPDLVALMPHGYTLWVEVKSPTGTLSPAQEAFRDLCKAQGTPWVCARSWDDVDRAWHAFRKGVGI